MVNLMEASSAKDPTQMKPTGMNKMKINKMRQKEWNTKTTQQLNEA